jgi:UDP-N-acetylmuramoyl-L-alanyl-D-glutamate--2,6-diaminopimelate ligase
MMAGSPLDELSALVGGTLLGGSATEVPLITDVTHDSRRVVPGSLFVAVRGASVDGHRFVEAALAARAAAVCVEYQVPVDVPQVVVHDTRRAMGTLAARVHGDPSNHLRVIGVTGTNGKTTVTHHVEWIARNAGVMTGLIGTVGARIGEQSLGTDLTTPEASDFQRLLARMRRSGCDLVAVEVSSHALALDRVRATRFEVAAFTNLSQDHLDFHGDMHRYLEAKEMLFHEYQVGTAVINVDDPAGRRIADRYRGTLIEVGDSGSARAEGIAPTSGGTFFRLVTPWGDREVEAAVIGRFNVDNAVVAAVCSLAAGIGIDQVVSGLATLPGVPGRFERVSGDDPVTVIVDYAHTPAGISHAIATARGFTRGRVIVLVGAGGDRDREKRPLMGEAVSAADVAVITSDNPRSEEPGDIVEAVVGGVVEGTEAIVEIDRRLAIRRALSEAGEGDVVLILGRGHEQFQEIGGEKVPFDDRLVATRTLADLRKSANFGAGTGSMGR